MKFLESFLGKFRGKEEHAEYTLVELEKILKDDRQKRDKEAYAEAAPVLKDIYSSFDNIRRIALEIKNLECQAEVNPRIKTVIRTAKPEFVREILEALKGSKEGVIEGLSAEKTAIGETMEMLAKSVIGPGKYLHMAYPEDIDRIRKELKTLAVKKKELEATGGSDGHIEDTLKEIESLIERLKHKKLLENEEEETRNRLKALEIEEKTLTEECRTIEEGKEYSEYNEKLGLLEKIKCEKEEKENYVYNLLTPLKRPLKILRKSLEEKGKADASFKEIEKYADDPINSLCLSEPKEFMEAFTALKKDIDNNRDLKAEEKSRVKQKISAIEAADLKNIRKHILDLRKNALELSVDIDRAEIRKRKTEKEKEVDRIRRERSIIEDELPRIIKKIEKDAHETKSKKQHLEENASRLKNRRVSVRLAP